MSPEGGNNATGNGCCFIWKLGKARNITWTPHLGEASCTIVQIHITQMNTAITTTV